MPMEKFKIQITKPDELPVVNPQIEVNEETTGEAQIEQCREIVQAKLETVLYSTLNAVNSRIQRLKFVDENTYLHEIQAFKENLDAFYQELQFLTYDVEYGLIDEGEHVAVPFEFNGEAMDRLRVLQLVTFVMRKADSALVKVNQAINDFEKVIEEARERFASAELEGLEKEQERHQSTITSRGEKKAKQGKRRDALVREINYVLRIDPKDTDSLIAGAEKLLTFMIANKWIGENISIDQATTPAERLKVFKITKLIDGEDESVKPQSAKNNSPAYMRTLKVAGLVAFIGLIGALTSSVPDKKSIKPPIYTYVKHYKSGDVTLIGFTKEANLSAAEKYEISTENSYRTVKGLMRGIGSLQTDSKVLNGQIPAIINQSQSSDIVDGKTYILDFKEEVLSKKLLYTRKLQKENGYMSTYTVRVRRSMIVSTVYEGSGLPASKRPLILETTKSENVYEQNPPDKSKLSHFVIDNSEKDLEYKVTRGKDGKAYIDIRRRGGKPFKMIEREKK